MTIRADGVEDMALAFLTCRDKGHPWIFLTDEITSSPMTSARPATPRTRACSP